LLGIASGRKSTPEAAATTDLVRNWIGEYKGCRGLIIGLLLIAEMAEFGIDHADREDVLKLIEDMIDADSEAKLSQKGYQLANAYASGGYEYLREKSPGQPYHSSAFLPRYVKILRDAVDANSTWSGT